MDLLKEDISIIHPPLLDETIYGYWKACMRVFIKSMDDLAWKAIISGWTPSTEKEE